MKDGTTLERKMLTYFGLIAAASLLVTCEFVFFLESVITNAASPKLDGSGADVGAPAESLMTLRNKAILMFVVQGAVTLIVLTMFIRRITGPLQHLVECAKKIAEGDLNLLIRVHSNDEIGLLGRTINNLTSNIQEIVAFGIASLGSLRSELSDLEMESDLDVEATNRLRDIQNAIERLDEMMREFSLFRPPLSAERGDEL